MTFDLGALADRFRRATERPLVLPPTAPPASAPAERPWLSAEAYMPARPAPRAAGGGSPAPGPSPVPPGSAARLTPEGPNPGRRRPRRRRWTVPTSPTERRQEPVDLPPAQFPCPFCREPHQPVPLRTQAGTFAPYTRTLVPVGETTTRPKPVGLTATQQAALLRDEHNAWRATQATEPAPPTYQSVRSRVRLLWYGDTVD